MTTTMKISIIIPIYNAEQTIRRCIESFLHQTFKDFELILVNDGSTDGSLSICMEYAEQHPFIHVVNKSNGGVSSARNAGMAVARGYYLTFTDADDEVYPHFLETFAQGEAGYDLFIQSIWQTDGGSSPEKIELNEEAHEGADRMAQMILDINRKDIPISACTSRFRHNLIQQHQLRFDERIAVCEDVDFVLRYLTHCQSAYTTAAAGYLYYTPASSKIYNEENALRTSLKLIQDAYLLTRNHLLRKKFRQCYFNWCIESLLLYQQDKEEAELFATQFGTLCQPYLSEAACTSFHHRLFRRLCFSPRPRVVLWAAKTSMKWYRRLKKMKGLKD